MNADRASGDQGAEIKAQGAPVSAVRTAKTVAWAFLGIRRKSGFEEDMGRLNPFHVIGVALLGVALFVGGLIALVKWVV